MHFLFTSFIIFCNGYCITFILSREVNPSLYTEAAFSNCSLLLFWLALHFNRQVVIVSGMSHSGCQGTGGVMGHEFCGLGEKCWWRKLLLIAKSQTIPGSFGRIQNRILWPKWTVIFNIFFLNIFSFLKKVYFKMLFCTKLYSK